MQHIPIQLIVVCPKRDASYGATNAPCRASSIRPTTREHAEDRGTSTPFYGIKFEEGHTAEQFRRNMRRSFSGMMRPCLLESVSGHSKICENRESLDWVKHSSYVWRSLQELF